MGVVEYRLQRTMPGPLCRRRHPTFSQGKAGDVNGTGFFAPARSLSTGRQSRTLPAPLASTDHATPGKPFAIICDLVRPALSARTAAPLDARSQRARRPGKNPAKARTARYASSLGSRA
ncbi:hypothetical protein JCM10599A_16190 [Paraburkholderia kururiensis]